MKRQSLVDTAGDEANQRKMIDHELLLLAGQAHQSSRLIIQQFISRVFAKQGVFGGNGRRSSGSLPEQIGGFVICISTGYTN
jgi:hypothetical protein